jgi:diguanylate cyclase (GGDEF)-like protein
MLPSLASRSPPGAASPSFERILQVLADPVLSLGPDGTILYANAAAEAAFGGGIVGSALHDLFPDCERGEHGTRDGTPRVLVTQAATAFESRFLPMGDGEYVVMLRAAASHDALAVERPDIDDLTGLSKRRTVLTHLTAMLSQEADAAPFAIHCLDLDRFKIVNDTLGHAVGDRLLRKVADRIVSACRKGDVVARLGGDEFVVLQHGARTPADAEKLAARLVDLVGRTYVLDGHTVNIGASVGTALRGDLTQARDVLRNGDLALYEAKRAGRGRSRLFQPGMDTLLHERREMEIDLRRALALKQFELHYQPFLDLASDEVIGFEALLRWRHPVRGNVPPLAFIPLAEENGLIVKIGEWVLRTACLQAATWPGERTVAVNVSPLQFKADTLLETVKAALERANLPPRRLELEITEGALLDNTDSVIRTLNALRDLGVMISMDDFGTGYSSLSYLQKFPFNKIKIDRSFVAGASADSEAILRAVAGLGTSLGMAITAEGVETAEQLARIRGERCTHVQGYLTGRPMAAEQIGDFLTRPDPVTALEDTAA